jgi:hypothetical protein
MLAIKSNLNQWTEIGGTAVRFSAPKAQGDKETLSSFISGS